MSVEILRRRAGEIVPEFSRSRATESRSFVFDSDSIRRTVQYLPESKRCGLTGLEVKGLHSLDLAGKKSLKSTRFHLYGPCPILEIERQDAIDPITTGFSTRSSDMIESTAAASAIRIKPIPKLNVRRMSSSGTSPSFCIRSKTADRVHAFQSSFIESAAGTTREVFPIIPPPVICEIVCIPVSCRSG